MGRRAGALLGAVALTLAAALAACSGSDDADESAALSPESESPSGTATADLGPLAAREQPVVRLVVRTASLEIETEDVDDAIRRAGDIVTAVGGSVFAQDTALVGRATSTLTLKVPPTALDDVLGDLTALGEVRTRTLGSDDVTDNAYDLDGRIATAETSVERLRTFLASTTDVGQVATLEGELTRREAELETLLGQRRSLQEQVDLATITLTLHPPEVSDAVESIPGVGTALASGLRAFWLVVRALAVALAFTLPFALVAGGLGWVAWRVSRRLRPPPKPAMPPPSNLP